MSVLTIRVRSHPSQASFPGARLGARSHTRVRRKGRWSSEIVYLVSRLTLDQLQAKGMLRLKRGYWVVESRLRHCLDLTMQEGLSRVRHPKAARVLGLIRRVLLSLTNPALDLLRQSRPKTKANTKRYRQRFLSARHGAQHLHALILSKSPDVLAFPK